MTSTKLRGSECNLRNFIKSLSNPSPLKKKKKYHNTKNLFTLPVLSSHLRKPALKSFHFQNQV